ncbi:MAG: sigma 54-interacting transcriptional regulator [Oscillibacter sp.]
MRGIYRGEKEGKVGLFELADGGTIFLDEIGEIPLDLQGRLLRVLQEHEILRIGGDKVQKIDIRVISATNMDLYSKVQEGKFRADLYYRLNVMSLTIAPLRMRSDDILLLLDYFLEKYGSAVRSEFLPPEVTKYLTAPDLSGQYPRVGKSGAAN